MALSRECVGTFHGQHVVLIACYADRMQSVQLKLYVASVCVDQRTVSTLDMTTHTLRGRLKANGLAYPVAAALTLKWFKQPTYTIAVGGRTIHEEQGPWHSL